MFTDPIPFTDAIAALAKRGLLPLSGNSAQISAIPPALLDESMFSSTVTDARILQAAQDRIAGILQPEGTAAGAYMDTARAREEIRQVLASIGWSPEPGTEGSIKDLYSQQRLDLIIDQNVAMARGRGQWAGTQDPDILDMWPCQELYRAEERTNKRNWLARWTGAGGELYGVSDSADFRFKRAIARKNAPVWYAISRFGTPWPPFDFGSGMDVADVSREEAVDLGVISENETVDPMQAPALALSASLANLEPFLVREVLAVLGGRAQASGGFLTFGGAS